MAYPILYLPTELLPFIPKYGSYEQAILSAVSTHQTDNNLSLHRIGYNVVMQPTLGEYILNSKQVEIVTDFVQLAGGRSFYCPYPNLQHGSFTRDKWWYARFKHAGGGTLTTPKHYAQDLYMLSLSLEFWLLVPGITPPSKQVQEDYA